jgi:hypothetical protein
VSEDRGKDADASVFFATLGDVGLAQNRVSILWDPAQPDVISAKPGIEAWLPLAQTAGVRVVFAVTSMRPGDFTSSPDTVGHFAQFLQTLARTFPQVKDYVIGNEPNQPVFWLPQFSPRGKPVSAAAYATVLGKSYDALKAVDPTINVIGIGLSPRGNDNPKARNNISRSPVRFLHDLGVAYRASHRQQPLMDALSYHPYPLRNTDPPRVGYVWPNAGLSNLGRIKQAVWDAFNGTPQPTFAETGKRTFSVPLRLELDEIGWQVGVDASLAGLYFGTETAPTIDEATQALYYVDAITTAECDPAISSLSFFLLLDEPNLARWQSGIERLDGSHRPSYDAVKQMLEQTHGSCQGVPARWKHTAKVVSPVVSWGKLRGVRSTKNRRWNFSAGAGEEAMFQAGIFKAGTSKSAIARRLQRGRPKPVLATKGTIKAKKRLMHFAARRLKAGKYVVAIRMQSTMNPARVSVLVSRPFQVAARHR